MDMENHSIFQLLPALSAHCHVNLLQPPIYMYQVYDLNLVPIHFKTIHSVLTISIYPSFHSTLNLFKYYVKKQ